MDEMKIKSNILTAAISKFVRKCIKNKLGFECGFDLKSIDMINDKGKTEIILHASVNTEDILKIIAKV